MHMLLTSLSATIYQSQIPILQYGQRHVDQMSIMHLRYVITGEVTPWIDNLITYITDPLNNEDPEPHSKSYNAGGTELPEQEQVRKTSKRRKTQHIVQKTSPPTIPTITTTRTHTISGTPCKKDHTSTHQHTKNNNTLSKPYQMETTHPPPKPYKSRPNRVQKALNMRKRKTPPLYPQHENRHQLESNKQIQSTIKHISVAQAPPCINMAFPAPSVMPHRNPPMNTPKYKQITLEHYKNWNRTHGTRTQKLT